MKIAMVLLLVVAILIVLAMLGVIIVGAIVGSEWSHWTWDDKYSDNQNEENK